MAKQEPTGVGNGLAALLGQPQVTPAKTAEVVAHVSPDPLPEAPKAHVETVQERQARQAAERVAALKVLNMVSEPVPVEVDIAALDREIAEAQAELKGLQALHADTLSRIAAAQRKVVEKQTFQKSLDTRTDAQINKEFIDRQIQMRAEEYEQILAKQQAILRSGLLTEREVAALGKAPSPLDQAIAKRNIQARRSGAAT